MKSIRLRPVLCACALATVGFAQHAIAGSDADRIPITTTSDGARMDFIAGQAAMDAGDNAQANALFRSAIEKDPNFGYAWLNLGNVAFSGQEFADSTTKADELADKVSEAERMMIKINMHFLDNDFDDQIALAKKLTNAYPKSARARMVLAGAQNNIQRFKAARQTMKSAIEVDPHFVPAYIGMANSYLFNEPKDFEKSKKYYKKAIALEPGQDNHYWGLGDAYRAMGKLEKARDYYTRSAQLDPNNGTAYTKRAHVNSFLGNFDEARADYDEAARVAQPAGRTFLANYKYFTYVYEGDPAKAVEGLKDLHAAVDGLGLPDQQRDGAKIFTLTNAAMICMHNGMDEDATALLGMRASEMRDTAKLVGTTEFNNIQEANIAYFDGLAAARKGDLAGAREHAKKNSELVADQKNPLKMQQYHDLMGLIELKAGNHADSAKHYRQANLNNIYTKYHLAMALDGAGEKDEAKKIYKEVAEFYFNSVGYALVREDAMTRS